MKLSNDMYDVLKWIAQILLPAFATMLSVVLALWGVFNAETITAIVGTISAIDTFLGALLGISSNNYAKEGE